MKLTPSRGVLTSLSRPGARATGLAPATAWPSAAVEPVMNRLRLQALSPRTPGFLTQTGVSQKSHRLRPEAPGNGAL